MSAGRHPRTSLRRFAASQVMLVLAVLLASLLPLHGVVNAASSIQSPAHYHSHASGDGEPGHAQPIDPLDQHNDGHDLSVVSHAHGHSPAGEHHESHDEHSAKRHDDDHHQATSARHDHDDAHRHTSVTPVARHAHALDAVDVVYLDTDSEQPDRGTTGKQLTPNGDALLPGWWMKAMPPLGAQVLPEPGCMFHSQVASPLRRPPSAGIRYA